MKELNDSQRINNITVKIVGIETPFDLKKSRTQFQVKYYINSNEPQIARMVPEESSHDKNKFFMIKSTDKKNLSFEFKINCISERDLSDYFKYMMQGSLDITLMSAKTNKKLALASL